MAKNRKNQSAAIRFGPALKALFLCLLIAGSAVGYVWQKSQIYQLGQQIRQREIRLARLQNDDQKLSDQLSILRSPTMLDRRGPRIESRPGAGAADAGGAAGGTGVRAAGKQKFDAPVCGTAGGRDDAIT